jgi:putative ABC transport system permease protein
MGMRITRGRSFSDADRWGAEQVIVVNESFASRDNAGNPLGVRLAAPFHDRGDLSEPKHWWRIVGVVADVKNAEAGAPAEPEVFGTFNQFDAEPPASLYLAVRTAGDPAALPVDLRTMLAAAGVPATLDQATTMEARLRRTLARPRLYATLVSGFAAFAVIVALMGLCGGLSYSVAQRTREIGVRTALGATPRQIVVMVLKHGSVMTLVGLTIGLAAAAATGRYFAAALFGVEPLDPATFAIVGTALIVTALVACAIPARRAAKIDAIAALRH